MSVLRAALARRPQNGQLAGSPGDPGDFAGRVRRRARPGHLAVIAVLAVIGAQFAVFVVGNPALDWPVVAQYLFDPTVMRGLASTILLAVAAMLLGTVLGTVLAACRLSPVTPLHWGAAAYVTVFRSVPPLVQLIFWFNLAYLLPVVSIGIPFGPTFASRPANDLITPLTAAVLGLGLNEAAYMAEIVRSGLLGVDRGQREAARALGYPPGSTFFRVVLPQALRVIVPPTGSQFITVLKGTSLVSVIAMTDLLYSVQTIYGRTYQVVPLLLVACLWYFAVVVVLSLGQQQLERRLGRWER